MKEIWKPVIGFEEAYAVSNQGRVKSLDRVVYSVLCGSFMKKGNLLSPFFRGKGYLAVNVFKNNKKYTKSVHTLVAEAFIENPNILPQINHIDGVKINNYVENLEWTTNSENQKHAYAMGLNVAISGSKSNLAKLNEQKVKQIKWLIKHGAKDLSLAYLYDVRNTNINQIRHEIWWKQVTISSEDFPFNEM